MSTVFNKHLLNILLGRRSFFVNLKNTLKNKKVNFMKYNGAHESGLCNYLDSPNYFKKILHEYTWVYAEYNQFIETTLDIVNGKLPLSKVQLEIEDTKESLELLECELNHKPINFKCEVRNMEEAYTNIVNSCTSSLYVATNLVTLSIPKDVKLVAVAEEYMLELGDKFNILYNLEECFKKYEHIIEIYIEKIYI